MLIICFLFSILFASIGHSNCILYPQDSETRQAKELNGLWGFVREETNSIGYGFGNKWYKRTISTFPNASLFPVPSSFNDLDQDPNLRDHVGWVWYQREFFAPQQWKSGRTVLRFGSVQYFAAVWVNSVNVANHTGGHLPFEADISSVLNFGGLNVVTVAVNNTLSHQTIPPGEFQYKTDRDRYPPGFFEQKPDFDFFNYAGILRPVYLYLTPRKFVSDISVQTDIDGKKGILSYKVEVGEEIEMARTDNLSFKVELLDKYDTIVGSNVFWAVDGHGTIVINHVHPWWPKGMNPEVAYLYQLTVILLLNGQTTDVYRIKIGFRTISYGNDSFTINGKPFYFHGFGMHEDAEIRGRGFDRVMLVKDLNLLEWMGGNSFRTSHYPYSEERFMEADRRGIVIIAETPAVGVRFFTDENLNLHRQLLTELINRDKNHPSVVMWSISNEPQTAKNSSRPYFKKLVDLAHEKDKTRPATVVYPTEYYSDKTADLVDIICFNRYYGWYVDAGRTDQITKDLIFEIGQWHKKFNKPIIMTEYGAGSVSGINYDPAVIFSEAYQVQVIMQHHKGFDVLRGQGLIGEMIWNFADFMTAPGITRVAGNRKGVLTRNRQPKMAAYVLRNRYRNLTQPSHEKFDNSMSFSFV